MIEVITRFRCPKCGTEYKDRRAAELCEAQGDPLDVFERVHGFRPKVRDVLVLQGHWGWVATRRNEWFGPKRVGNGIHKTDTYDVYYLVVNIRPHVGPLSEDLVRDEATGKTYTIKTHKVVIDVVTRAHENDLKSGKSLVEFGHCGWTSVHHWTPKSGRVDARKRAKILKQADELIEYWTKLNPGTIDLL